MSSSLTGGTYHPSGMQSSTSTNSTSAGQQQAEGTTTENGQERARVVCDYDARDPGELSLMQDEVNSSKFEI